MPIEGMTTPSVGYFSKIADVRKGGPKRKNKAGQKVLVGRDLKEWLRVSFTPGNEGEIDRFKDMFAGKFINDGEERHVLVKQIKFIFPFKTTTQVWDANLEAHQAGYMIGRSNGVYWKFLRGSDGRAIVRNGRVIVPHADAMGNEYGIGDRRKFFPYEPVGKDKHGQAIFCRVNARLQIMIPAFGIKYFEVHSTSYNDVHRISGLLAGFSRLAESLGGTIAGVPFILNRVPVKISKPIKGRRTRSISWLLNIELDPEYVRRNIGLLQSQASQYLEAGPVEGVDEPPAIEPEDISQEPPVEPEPEPEPESLALSDLAIKSPRDRYYAEGFAIYHAKPQELAEILAAAENDFETALVALRARFEEAEQ